MSLWQRLSYARAVMGIMHGSRAFGGPVQAYLSLTNRCNIRCIHCYFYSPYIERPNLFEVKRARLMGAELPDDEYLRRLQSLDVDLDRTRALIDELLAMGTRQFLFTGSGEPFLHKNAIEFMGHVKHAGCTCIVNTNGTLLNSAMIDELIKMGFDKLRITLMAGTPEMYARTHPGMRDETFDSLRDNLLYLAERKAALSLRKPAVSLVFIVVSQNYNGIFDFAEFAKLVQADRVLFHPVDGAKDPSLVKSLVPTSEQAASVRKQLSEVKAYLESQRVAHNISYFLKVFREQLDTTALYRVIPCYYGWLSIRIDTDGQVYPCCRCYEPLGNMDEKKLHEVWNGSAYRRFRQEAMQINRRKSPVSGCDCNSCPHSTANLRVYRILHPVKGRSARLERLCPAFSEEGE